MKQKVIELHEYDPKEVPREELPLEAAELLRQRYQDKIKVETTSFLPGSNWRLTSQGYVGYIPLTPEIGIRLLPKRGISISNLFGMLEYAYSLKSFQLLDGLIECNCIEDLYDRLAKILARRVLDRGRRGFYHAYQSKSDNLAYLRGRIDLKHCCLRPWEVRPYCHFEEHTSDVEENRIIAWTLFQILQSGVCKDQSLPFVRQAYHTLQSFTTLAPFDVRSCMGRVYSRLNQDYEPIHALCRFFLENRGPGHEVGDRKMIPFVVDMAHLYELFVANWMKAHLPESFSIEVQEKVLIDNQNNIKFRIDLVIYDEEANHPVFVMDTKYKVAATSSEDVAQVIAYAEAKGCHEAVLIYPEKLESDLNIRVGDIHVRRSAFPLRGDLEESGNEFLKDALYAAMKLDMRGYEACRQIKEQRRAR